MSVYFTNTPLRVRGCRDWRWLWLRRRPDRVYTCCYGIDESGAVFSMEFTENGGAQ
jgi:hypothetical protein